MGSITIGLTFEEDTKFFIKPIGSIDNKIYEGDFSKERFLYFSKKRPNSVRIGDILICYAVGSTKLISIFKVLSEPINTNRKKDRWPWYVKAKNISPKFGKYWNREEFSLSYVIELFVKNSKTSILTYNGGETLGALQFGADKIRLDEKFAKFLISLIENSPNN